MVDVNDDIINGNMNIYEFLDLNSDASESEIKRSYRKKALIYHPDKNPDEESMQKFHLLSKIYEILTNSSLKNEYDRIRQIKLSKKIEVEKLSEDTRRFREELERAEQEYQFNSRKVFDRSNEEFVARDTRTRKVEQLQEEGMRKRRKREQERINESSSTTASSSTGVYKSYRDVTAVNQITCQLSSKIDLQSCSSKSRTLTVVKWKFKPELKGLIDEGVLREMMSIFGETKTVTVIPNDKKHPRYESGLVEFSSPEDALKATSHDYRKSAKLWDGTKVRKLSSLLRECKFQPKVDSFTEEEISYITSYVRDKYPQLGPSLLEVLEGDSKLDELLRVILQKDIKLAM